MEDRSKLRLLFGKRWVRVFGVVAVLWLLNVLRVRATRRIPPTYNVYHDRERNLPQHSLDLPPPNGQTAKYLYFGNYIYKKGWGNVMQELITNSNLAWETNRSFVFHNYTWEKDVPYSSFNGNLIPSHIPLSAIISGPIIGGSFDTLHAHLPLSVSAEYFNRICPNPVTLDYGDVPESYNDKLEGSELLRLWTAKINSINDPCVMIRPESPSVFDNYFFGDPRAMSLYPSLKKSPALTQFDWSPLVMSAFDANRHLFLSSPRKTPKYALIPNLLVLHIRRGDYSRHCKNLANWSANWNTFNRFPSLPDQFEKPLDGHAGWTTPANMAMYLRKCLPTIPQIVQRVTYIKNTNAGAPLTDIFIMTNGGRTWIDQLSRAFEKAHPGLWKSIRSSRDFELDWDQKFVAQAVDMYIGERAGVFVGNGFSSLTSNVVLMRMQRDVPPEQTRFW